MTRSEIEAVIHSPRIRKAALSLETERTPEQEILLLVYRVAGSNYQDPTEAKVEAATHWVLDKISDDTSQEEGLRLIHAALDRLATRKPAPRKSPLWTPRGYPA